MAATPSLPALPCPDCSMSPDKRRSDGKRRIGHSRATCSTCNAFVREVARRALKQMIAEFPNEHARIRLMVEAELYPRYIAAWNAEHPGLEDQRRASAALEREVDDTLRQLAAGLGVEP